MSTSPGNGYNGHRTGIIVLGAVVVLGIMGLAYLLIRGTGRFVVGTIEYATVQIASVSGWNLNLVKGLVIILTIPFFWAVAKYTHIWWKFYKGLHPSLRLYRNRYGMIIVAYVGVFFLAMYSASRGNYFTTSGEAQRWCAETPEGIRICDAPGVDPVYGIECKPCTREQIALLRQREAGVKPPTRTVIANPHTFEFFDPLSGRAKVWYERLHDGGLRFYDGPGNLVKPIDQAVITEMMTAYDEAQSKRKDSAATEEATKRALEHERYVNKYVNTSVHNRKEATQTAILVLDGQKHRFTAVESEIAQVLSEQGAEAVPALFRPAFITDGLAESLAGGDWKDGSELGLSAHVDNLVVGTGAVSYTENPDMQNILTARLTLDLHYYESTGRHIGGTKRFTVSGAGFDQEKALEAAVQNAQSKIEEMLKRPT